MSSEAAGSIGSVVEAIRPAVEATRGDPGDPGKHAGRVASGGTRIQPPAMALEGERDLGCAAAGGDVQRRHTVVGDRVWVRAMAKQELDHAGVTALNRDMERREAIRVMI